MTAPYGLWTLDENPAQHNTTITDTGSGGNNGTLITNDGSTNKSVTGRVGQGITFDGTDDYISIANQSNFNFNQQAFTVTFWVKDVTAVGFAVAKGATPGTPGWFVAVDSSSVDTVFRATGGTTVMDSGPGSLNFNDGVWHQIALVLFFDTVTSANNHVDTYVDGVLKTSDGGSATPNLSSEALTWGTRLASGVPGSPFFVGKMDDVRVYNVGLSANEILALHARSLQMVASYNRRRRI